MVASIKQPSFEAPAPVAGTVVRHHPRSALARCRASPAGPSTSTRKLNVTGRRELTLSATDQVLVHQGRGVRQAASVACPDVGVGRALDRSAVAVLIITSIVGFGHPAHRGPDSIVDKGRCTTREFSRTVLFRCVVQGIPPSGASVGLDAGRGPYDDCISSASWCAGPPRC